MTINQCLPVTFQKNWWQKKILMPVILFANSESIFRAAVAVSRFLQLREEKTRQELQKHLKKRKRLLTNTNPSRVQTLEGLSHGTVNKNIHPKKHPTHRLPFKNNGFRFLFC